MIDNEGSAAPEFRHLVYVGPRIQVIVPATSRESAGYLPSTDL